MRIGVLNLQKWYCKRSFFFFFWGGGERGSYLFILVVLVLSRVGMMKWLVVLHIVAI